MIRTLAATVLFLTGTAFVLEPAQRRPAWQSRTVEYDRKDIVSIATQIRYTTLVILPEHEQILDFVVGDKDFWVVEGVQNFAYIKPSKAGASSNVSLITATGNIYSLAVYEVSQSGGNPDLKVFINVPEDVVAQSTRRFVSIDEHEQLRQALVGISQDAERGKNDFRREYGERLHFVYKFDRHKDPFNVSAIYHDGRFTYIHSNATERPVLYEYTPDNGKLNLVNFQMQGQGFYIVPKVLTRGQLSIGNKKMKFEIDKKLAAATMLRFAGVN